MNPNLPEYTCNHPKLLYLEIWITFVIPTLKKNEYAEKKVGNWHSTFNNNAPKLHTTEEKVLSGQQIKIIQAVYNSKFHEYYSKNLTFFISD